VELLRTWKEYEQAHGDEADLKAVEAMMPWQVTSFRKKDEDEDHETCELQLSFPFPLMNDRPSLHFQLPRFLNVLTNVYF
jgi:hypothetical protein